jgi:hypothetical protein
VSWVVGGHNTHAALDDVVFACARTRTHTHTHTHTPFTVRTSRSISRSIAFARNQINRITTHERDDDDDGCVDDATRESVHG